MSRSISVTSSDMSLDDQDHFYMARALELARRGRYSTQPNPHVGSVIVQSGTVVGEAYHRKAGQPHAEVLALREAGKLARGATVYVTLEPCSHTGRTPPCADQLIDADVSRVVFATEDPNPKVAGAGAARLRAAGIDVCSGFLAEPARQLNRGFFFRMEHGRPFVTLKIAMSLDGKIGLKSGESKWITGSDSRSDVQQLRARSSAVLTGTGTVRADNPKLNVRDESLDTGGRQPHAVVLDSRFSLETSYDIFKTDSNCILVTAKLDEKKQTSFANNSVAVHRVSGTDTGVDLEGVLTLLGDLECNEVLVEAGPTLVSSFIEQEIWNELIVYVAPTLIGSGGKDGFAGKAIQSLVDARKLRLVESRSVGVDLRLTYEAT